MDGGPSRTAWAVANHRAAHQLLEAGRIFADPTAVAALGLPAEVVRADALAHPERRPMRLYIASRHRRADEVVAEALTRGTRQVLLLGAGLDTTAYRLEAPAGTTVFEVDHPATQSWKLGHLAATDLTPTVDLVHVPVDLEEDSLADALAGAGLAMDAPTVVLWLGVVPYLERSAVEATLRLLSGRPWEVLLDYGPPASDRDPRGRAWLARRAAAVAAVGEPWVTFLEPAEVQALLGRHGLVVEREDPAPALVRAYLGLPDGPPVEGAGRVLHAVPA